MFEQNHLFENLNFASLADITLNVSIWYIKFKLQLKFN